MEYLRTVDRPNVTTVLAPWDKRRMTLEAGMVEWVPAMNYFKCLTQNKFITFLNLDIPLS